MKLSVGVANSSGVTPERLAEAWNADPACRALGDAEYQGPVSKSVGEAVLPIVISIGTGIASSLIYDQLKILVRRLSENAKVVKSDESYVESSNNIRVE